MVVPLAEIGVLGIKVTLKSEALVPPIDIYGDPPVKFRANNPVFSIVKVCASVPLASFTFPKSVSSVTDGVVSPSAIELPLPWISISGAGTTAIPVIVKVYGSSSLSSLSIDTVAV